MPEVLPGAVTGGVTPDFHDLLREYGAAERGVEVALSMSEQHPKHNGWKVRVTEAQKARDKARENLLAHYATRQAAQFTERDVDLLRAAADTDSIYFHGEGMREDLLALADRIAASRQGEK